MKTLKLSEICAMLDTECPKGAENITIDDICKDSRAARPGSLFIPLPGTRFDGHDFIKSAEENGASATLCDRAVETSLPCVRVDKIFDAYQRLAGEYKKLFPIPTVGVTGSVGKTTTALMVRSVLSKKYELLTTDESNNGQIGLPFALFRLEEKHTAAVLEMGMSQSGELTRLTNMVQPDVAIINNIGTAHIEFFGTREKICEAKLEILKGLKPGGTVILNGDEPLLWNLRGTLPFRTVYCALLNPEADIRADIVYRGVDYSNFVITAGGEKAAVHLPAPGDHMVSNALMAAAAGMAFGMTLSECASALEDYSTAHGRLDVGEYCGVTIIDDSYNASPEAVKASLGILKNLPAKRKFAVLGAMKELGDHSRSEHIGCGKACAECADVLVTCGEEGEWYADGARSGGMGIEKIFTFTDREGMAQKLSELVKPGDAVIFKGSHSTRMDLVMEEFKNLIK